MKVGLGLQYDISPSMQLRGEAERYRINDAFDNRGDVNVFLLALVFPIGRAAARPKMAAAPPYVAPAPVPVVSPPPPVLVAVAPPPPAPVPVRPAPRRVQLSADSLFSFDKSALTPDGKTALDTFARDTRGTTFDSITVEGNADRLGSAAYNQKLSVQRADAVKVYLASTPELKTATINASGKGESNPMTKPGDCEGKRATKALITCLQPDRRVDVEMTGLR
jgi:OOP family OmpA-OmpF porin